MLLKQVCPHGGRFEKAVVVGARVVVVGLVVVGVDVVGVVSGLLEVIGAVVLVGEEEGKFAGEDVGLESVHLPY
jgi:hypothetical protein